MLALLFGGSLEQGGGAAGGAHNGEDEGLTIGGHAGDLNWQGPRSSADGDAEFANGPDGLRPASGRQERGARDRSLRSSQNPASGTTAAERRRLRSSQEKGSRSTGADSRDAGLRSSQNRSGSAGDDDDGRSLSVEQFDGDDEEEDEEEEEELEYETGYVSGTVILPDGTLAAGATVQYVGPIVSAAAGLQAMTNGDGVFTMGDVPLPGASLQAWDDQYVSAVVGAEVREEPGAAWVTIQLEPASGLVVTVLEGENDQPLAKAAVFVQRANGEELAPSRSSGEQGVVEFSALPAGECWVQAGKQGYSFGEFGSTDGRKRVTLVRGEVAKVTLTLSRTAAASGVVLAEDGSPLGGASLHVRMRTINTSRTVTFQQAYAVSDAEGAFSIQELPDGDVDLLAVMPDYGVSSWYPSDTDMSVVVGAGATVTGIVKNLVGGTVPGAVVELGFADTTLDSILTRYQTVGGDARFTFHGVPALALELSAAKDERNGELAVPAAAVGQGLLELEITGVTTISGFIESVHNRAVPGAVVRVHGAAGILAETTTDGSGRYELAVEDPETWLVSARSEEFAPTHAVLEPTAMELTQNLRLHEGNVLEVMLEGAPDSGVANIRLWATELPAPPYYSEWLQLQLPNELSGRIGGLATGQYRLDFNVPGVISYSRIVSVPGDPVLLRIFEGQTISGQVVNEDGEPAAGVSVTLQTSMIQAVFTDVAGRFVLDGIYPGAHVLLATSESHTGTASALVESGFDIEGVRMVLDMPAGRGRQSYTLGVRFGQQDGTFVVSQVTPETNAAEAGLLPGDVVTQINGLSVEGWNAAQIQAALNADPTAAMLLALEREGTPFAVRLQWTRVEE